MISAITTTTTAWLFFWTTTTVAVGWPLLIAGLLAGAFLIGIGVLDTAMLRSRLEDRFEEQITPQLRAVLVGDGVTRAGVHVPSLRAQLQQQFRRIAQAARTQPAAGGNA